MKKFSFVLALILACGVLASCTNEPAETSGKNGSSNNPPSSSSTPNKTGDPSAPKSTEQSTDDPTPPSTPEEEEKPLDELLDGSKFTVDGDLSEWEGLHTMVLQGEASTAAKSATFYGVMTTKGLYLACDAYHDIYTTGQSEWHRNTNFEMFISTGDQQVFAYANGITEDCLTGAGDNATTALSEAVMKTEEINGDTKYHTTVEVFIPTESLPEDSVYINTVSVGVGWKTPSDLIIGGQYHINEDGSDEYWVVKGYNCNECGMVATPKGLYFYDDYMPE